MKRINYVETLDNVPVNARVRDHQGRVWEHVRASGPPWEDYTPAWVVVSTPEGLWHPGTQSDTMNMFFAYGPFFFTECGGRDPAFAGLECYLDSGHPEECEFFTAETGRKWRQRAMVAEEKVTAWEGYFHIDTDHWKDALEYAVVALEGSSDNGDRYCAAQIKAALEGATT